MGLAAASRTLTISAVAPSVAVCAQPARGVLAGWRMTSSAAATAHALLPPRQAVVCATRQAPWVLRVRCASLTSIWRPAAVPPSPPSCSAQRETCRPAVRLSGEQYPVGICRPAVRWAVAPFYSCDAHVLARTSRWNARQFGTASRDAAAEVEAGRAALQEQLETDGPLDKQTLVGDAVKACCAALGRDHEEPEVQDMITWLKSNWYNTLGDLASMTVEEAAQLKVPLRMLNWMKEALGKDPAAQEGDTSITMDLSQVVGAIKASSVAESHGSHGKWVFTGETPAPLTKRKHLQPYSLPMKDCPERVNKELEAFYRFCTVKSFKRQTKTVAPVSAKRYCNLIRRMLGWMHYHQGVPLETLSIKDLIPSSDRAGAEKAFDFLTWLEMERGCSPRTLVLQAAAILVLGHYLFHEQSHASPSEGDKPYNDILAIRELRRLAKQVGEGSNNNTSVSNIEMKWIDWPQYLQVVNTLEGTYRDMAAAHKMDGSVPERQVAMALQQYLIFGILACIPDRQRTIRELEHGKTLIRTQDDRWVIRHSAEDYKTGKQYGDRPDLLISPYLYEDLEAWLSRYRAVLSPDHTRVFTGARGAAFSDSNFSAYFSKACYRVTGKRMNPHLVRDSIVTFLRRGDHSQKTLESLALYMGHSVAMQRDTYDRRTKKEKAAPAAELLIQQLMQTLDV